MSSFDPPPSTETPLQDIGKNIDEDTGVALAFRGVERRLANGTVLLRDLSFSLPRGGVLVLAGPSGAGKSTLLRLANRLDETNGGEITVLGRKLRDWPVRELRRRVALVFQEPNLLGLTVRENLLLPWRYQGHTPTDSEPRMREALKAFDLDGNLLDRSEGDLSVGQKQRVCLARSLIENPELVLLDEPTAALDPPTANLVLAYLRDRIAKDNLTVVLGTHRLEEARMLGGHMAVLLAGRIEAFGATEALLAHPPEGPGGAFLRESGAGSARRGAGTAGRKTGKKERHEVPQ